MSLLLIALGIPVAGGALAVALGRFPRAATAAGVSSAVIGCVLGLVAIGGPLSTGATIALRLPWRVPYGEFSIAVDPLSAVFLLVIFGVSLLAAAYGAQYLLAYRQRKSLGAPWLFFNLLVASMALLVMARNGILFLMAWEVMAIASFFLVTFEHEKADVRNAGWTYLVAAHVGTAFLLVFFAILGLEAGSMDFDRFAALQPLAPALASALFLLAVAGFGAKAGFVPLHVWLPEAHPAAPSHVSALMSGVMLKTGIYGILRALTFLGPPPAWWGLLLICIGLTSGVLGVLFALAQHDLKRLLAYHSVENIGIIALGMGVGVWGMSQGQAVVAVLGFSGAVLHVVNHAVFKALLFLGAGSVLHATGERKMDRLGGLLKKMPVTGGTFLIAAAAISGVPPLNGFVSEFLIIMGALSNTTDGGIATAAPLLAVVGLGLIGGLAVACFTKAFGVVFLGSPRTGRASQAHESPVSMLLPMIILAVLCVVIGVGAPLAAMVVLPAAAQVAGADSQLVMSNVVAVTLVARNIAGVAAGVLVMVALLALGRWLLLAGRKVTTAVTWDCGYERPTPRMQYTSSSFAQPLVDVFSRLLSPRSHIERPTGYFPHSATLHTETPDVFLNKGYRPLFEWINLASISLRWLQHGRVHLYLLYIFVTLVVLLIWQLGLRGGV